MTGPHTPPLPPRSGSFYDYLIVDETSVLLALQEINRAERCPDCSGRLGLVVKPGEGLDPYDFDWNVTQFHDVPCPVVVAQQREARP